MRPVPSSSRPSRPQRRLAAWLALSLLSLTLSACAEVRIPRIGDLGDIGGLGGLWRRTEQRTSQPAPQPTPQPTPQPPAQPATPSTTPSTTQSATAPEAGPRGEVSAAPRAADQPAPAAGVVTPDAAPVPPPPPSADGLVRVGLLVPLSGPQAELGQAMVNAATLALFDFNDQRLVLVPRDAGDSAESGRAASTQALDAGARLILGPVFAKAVAGAGEAARARGVNLIAFSSDRSVAGPGAYLLGFLPDDDVRRIVGYASRQGMRQFAGLVPDTAYGARVRDAFRASVAEVQGEIVTMEGFVEQPTQLSEPMRRIAAAQGRPAPGPDGAPPAGWAPRFQALLLAEGGAMLTSLAALLPYHEVDARVRVLGTGLWDDARIAREPTLNGGWFAAADPAARRDFADRYAKTFGKVPPRLASLAYDAVALAVVLTQQSGGGDPFLAERLTQAQGFVGVDGIFRLRPDGTPERGLAVIEVQRDGFRVIDPAPTSFAAPAPPPPVNPGPPPAP